MADRLFLSTDGKALDAVQRCGMEDISDLEGLWKIVKGMDIPVELLNSRARQ